MKKKILIGMLLCSLSPITLADTSVKLALVSNHEVIGTVTLSDAFGGTLITPALTSLSPGQHGFHLHVNASCDDNAQAAGGHFDPKNTGKHLGPYNTSGHLGDLPVLIVDEKGQATAPIFVPRLTVKEFAGHALMIHAGGDNYADMPEKLGGGGARIACGVVG